MDCGAVLLAVEWALPITMLGPLGCDCTIVTVRAVTGNQDTDVVHEDGNGAMNIWIGRLLQKIADLIHSFEQ